MAWPRPRIRPARDARDVVLLITSLSTFLFGPLSIVSAPLAGSVAVAAGVAILLIVFVRFEAPATPVEQARLVPIETDDDDEMVGGWIYETHNETSAWNQKYYGIFSIVKRGGRYVVEDGFLWVSAEGAPDRQSHWGRWRAENVTVRRGEIVVAFRMDVLHARDRQRIKDFLGVLWLEGPANRMRGRYHRWVEDWGNPDSAGYGPLHARRVRPDDPPDLAMAAWLEFGRKHNEEGSEPALVHPSPGRD